MSFASDANGFVERGNDGIALAAHVRGVNAAELRGLGCQSDQFFGRGIRRGRVLQRSGYANRAVVHRLAHQRLHAFELGGRRRAIVVADHGPPHLSGADVAGQIDPHALLFQAGEVLAERAPGRLDSVVLEGRAVGGANSVGHRRGRSAFAGNFGGDALIDLGRQVRVHQDRFFDCPSMSIKPGATTIPPRRCSVSRPPREMADRRDVPVTDRDVGRVPGRSRAVDDVAVANHEVELLSEQAQWEQEQKREFHLSNIPLLDRRRMVYDTTTDTWVALK